MWRRDVYNGNVQLCACINLHVLDKGNTAENMV